MVEKSKTGATSLIPTPCHFSICKNMKKNYELLICHVYKHSQIVQICATYILLPLSKA